VVFSYVYGLGEFSHEQNATYLKNCNQSSCPQPTRRQQLNELLFLRYDLREVCCTTSRQNHDEMLVVWDVAYVKCFGDTQHMLMVKSTIRVIKKRTQLSCRWHDGTWFQDALSLEYNAKPWQNLSLRYILHVVNETI